MSRRVTRREAVEARRFALKRPACGSCGHAPHVKPCAVVVQPFEGLEGREAHPCGCNAMSTVEGAP